VISVQVLTVCTGNVCRSPAMERLLRAALAGTDDDRAVSVGSAGTHALVGRPISLQMATLLESVGASSGLFRARALDLAALSASDLVLTATTSQRTAVVSQAPAVLRRAFTLLEFARLVSYIPSGAIEGETPAARLRSLVDVAPTYRARANPGPNSIADPWGKSDADYRRCFDLVFAGVLDIVDAVTR
jgi:protein-tyrosine phosphatase